MINNNNNNNILYSIAEVAKLRYFEGFFVAHLGK